MELTTYNIYKALENLGYSSEETIYGCNLIKEYIKQETHLSDDKVGKVFNYCWEQGHSVGVYEVFSYAIEICELISEVL
jgi:hypothetical protein